MFLRQEPSLDAPPRMSGVARLRAQKCGQFSFYHDHLGRNNQVV